MRFRIAEAPARDTENEGRTLTPFWMAVFLDINVFELLRLANMGNLISMGGYSIEVLHTAPVDDMDI